MNYQKIYNKSCNENFNIKVGVVVLNYNNYNETLKCVESLLKQKSVLLEIVIVDNGSTNDSYDILTKSIIDKKVSFIKSEKNLGYACGNNIGIKHLREMGCEFIFISNSDLIFLHDTTLIQLIQEYEKGVGLINPIIKNYNDTVDQRVTYKKRYLYLRILKKYLEWLFQIDLNFNLSKNECPVNKMTGIQSDRYIVAGSGFLLTPDYFDNYHGLYPKTFLYFEEWATIILLHKAQLKTKVANFSFVLHKGGASTPKNIKEVTKQRRKICSNSWSAIFKLAIMPAPKIKEKY